MRVEVETEDRGGVQTVPAIDPCVIAPRPAQHELHYIAATIGEQSMPWFVSRSFDPGDKPGDDDAAKTVRQCGGWIYPSLAVGHLPASNFGLVTMFAHVGVALQGMRPLKGKGRYPVVVYDGDAWTGVTRLFIQSAPLLYKQLTGRYEVGIYGRHHMLTLGPDIESSFGFGAGTIRVVPSTAKLRRLLAQRAKVWPQKLTKEGFDRASEALSVSRYPYLEAKCATVVGLEHFPVVACPAPMMKAAERWLGSVGWNGTLLHVPVSQEQVDHLQQQMRDIELYRYAWAMRKVVLDYAEALGLVGPVPLAS